MGSRAIVSLTNGCVDASFWLMAVREEPTSRAKPKACAACPLRSGGEWDEGASAAVAQMTPTQRKRMGRWSCHAERRPCAGMRRIVAKVERKAVFG